MKYPNIELLEYKFRETLEKDEMYLLKRRQQAEQLPEYSSFYKAMDMEARMFRESWPTTALAFDVDRNGRSYCAGQAFTNAYTVILHETITDVYGVYVDERLAYVVYEANEKFLSDVNTRHMCTISEAMEQY